MVTLLCPQPGDRVYFTYETHDGKGTAMREIAHAVVIHVHDVVPGDEGHRLVNLQVLNMPPGGRSVFKAAVPYGRDPGTWHWPGGAAQD